MESIEQKHPRIATRLRKQNITQQVAATNDVFFGFSKCSPSAVYDHKMMEDVRSILKHGCMSEGSKGEAFLNGKRIPGGLQLDDDVLPEGLTDMLEAVP